MKEASQCLKEIHQNEASQVVKANRESKASHRRQENHLPQAKGLIMSKEHLFEHHMEAQKGLCAECGQPLVDRYTTQIDRITPGKEGGAYTIENTRLICLECDWEKEGNAPNSPKPRLAATYRLYKMWQIEAGRMDRKIRAYQGNITGTTRSPYIDEFTLEELGELLTYFQQKEHDAALRLKRMVRTHAEWKGFMKDAPGLAEITAGMLLSRVRIDLAETVSCLWSFLGYAPPKDGEKYNPGKGKDFKSALYAALSISLTRHASPYRKIYDTYKARELKHGAALQRTIKLWLSHLWSVWREWEGLPVTAPYANNHLGHDGFYDAGEFGW